MQAGSPRLRGVAGRYFEDGNEARVVHDSSGWIEGVAPWAIDPVTAERPRGRLAVHDRLCRLGPRAVPRGHGAA
jgi:hypothetical protein